MAPQKRKRSRKARTEVSPSPSSSSDSSSNESAPDVRPAKTAVPAAQATESDSRKVKKRKHARELQALPAATNPTTERATHNDDDDDNDDDHDDDHEINARSPATAPRAPVVDSAAPAQAFQDFYLRQMTREFADDLEKLRAAKDFRGEASVGLLVRALRQSARCFSPAEMHRVGAAVAAAGR